MATFSGFLRVHPLHGVPLRTSSVNDTDGTDQHKGSYMKASWQQLAQVIDTMPDM